MITRRAFIIEVLHADSIQEIEKMITDSNLKSKAARRRAMQAARDGAV